MIVAGIRDGETIRAVANGIREKILTGGILSGSRYAQSQAAEV